MIVFYKGCLFTETFTNVFAHHSFLYPIPLFWTQFHFSLNTFFSSFCKVSEKHILLVAVSKCLHLASSCVSLNGCIIHRLIVTFSQFFEELTLLSSGTVCALWIILSLVTFKIWTLLFHGFFFDVSFSYMRSVRLSESKNADLSSGKFLALSIFSI